MYGISGIKHQKKLEKLALFNKKTAQILIDKEGDNLDKKIQRLLNKGYLVNLKKGWYVTQPYLDTLENPTDYKEYLANQLRKPSYLSLEYMLAKYNLIPETIHSLISITKKTTREYENKLGSFNYKNIKEDLFCGYEKREKGQFQIYEATKAKALFDYLYLKSNLSKDLAYELRQGLRINWSEFAKNDRKEFKKYVVKAEMDKMKKALAIINEINYAS
jgi:predicted transcriptional regulator of viral defense system